MFFKNLLAYIDGTWTVKDICVDYPIASVEYTPDKDRPYVPHSFLDTQEEYVWMPGFYDTHIHGIDGHDFSEGTLEAYAAITKKLGEQGVAYCAATYVSMDLDELKKALTALDSFVVTAKEKTSNTKPMQQEIAAQILSVHLEGPFIAKDYKGAHAEHTLQETISLEQFLEIIKAAPHIKDWKITLAPELPGALEFIEQTRGLMVNDEPIGVHVFIGHTNAESSIVQQAFEKGAEGFTHLGNANGETAHRQGTVSSLQSIQSNVVRYALEQGKIPVELIVDDQHLSSEFIAFVYEHVRNNVLLISDALSPAGMKDGEYRLGSLAVLKEGSRIVLKDNPEKLAGSATLLPELAANFLEMLLRAGIESQDCWNALYHALVVNPRNTSITDINSFDDKRNFVILDKKTGKLMLSGCNGVVTQHQPFTVPPKQDSQLGFFEQSESVKTDEEPHLMQKGVG